MATLRRLACVDCRLRGPGEEASLRVEDEVESWLGAGEADDCLMLARLRRREWPFDERLNMPAARFASGRVGKAEAKGRRTGEGRTGRVDE